MDAQQLADLQRVWLDRWRDLDAAVRQSLPTPTHAHHIATSLVPEHLAEGIRRRVYDHLDALNAYLAGMREFRTEPPKESGQKDNAKLAYSITEVAAALGVSRGTLYEAVRQRRIASVQLGKRILILRAAIDRFLNGEGPGEPDNPWT